MSNSVCSTDKLRDLDDRERRAWSSYSESIRELAGTEYELAESESWDQLQGELRKVARHRDSLAKAPG